MKITIQCTPAEWHEWIAGPQPKADPSAPPTKDEPPERLIGFVDAVATETIELTDPFA